MTAAQIFQLARFITNTNSTTASDTNLLRSLTERHKQLFIKLSDMKEGYGETTATDNLVSGTAAYSLPTSTLRLKRAEVQYATGGSWANVSFFDINERSGDNSSTSIASDFSKERPYGDVVANTLVLYPIPDANVTSGLKFWYVPIPSEISSTATTPTAPEEYHRLLADLISIDIRLMKADISGTQALQAEDVIWKFLKEQLSPRVSGQSLVMRASYTNYD
jgi:hypothetical protein